MNEVAADVVDLGTFGEEPEEETNASRCQQVSGPVGGAKVGSGLSLREPRAVFRNSRSHPTLRLRLRSGWATARCHPFRLAEHIHSNTQLISRGK